MTKHDVTGIKWRRKILQHSNFHNKVRKKMCAFQGEEGGGRKEEEGEEKFPVLKRKAFVMLFKK
jgi:hypothetical protein